MLNRELEASSYLQYLPPVLWDRESPASEFSLGMLLRVFEKILTGIDDGTVVRNAARGSTPEHEHESLAAAISRLHLLFSPWSTSAEFLPWLATWVSLSFPDVWDEYQRRKVTSQIVSINQRRGLREGLNRFLELYNGAEKQPRISIDDGSRILYARPDASGPVRLDVLISQGGAAPIGAQKPLVDGLIAPRCLTLGVDGSLIVGDAGTPDPWAPKIDPGLWRISPAGAGEFAGAAAPRRLAPTGMTLRNPLALAVEPGPSGRLFVLDNVFEPNSQALYQVVPDFSTATGLATRAALGAGFSPVAMAFDQRGHLLILDRGRPVPTGSPSETKIIDIVTAPAFTISNSPLLLPQVVEPLSLLVLPNGDLVVGDGREQDRATPADLMYVNRQTATPAVTPLLANLAAGKNPLVAPVALIRQDDATWYALDLGLKAYDKNLDPVLKFNPFCRSIAVPATIFKVTLTPGASPLATTVTLAATMGELVVPTGMVLDRGTLYVSDQGEFANPDFGQQLRRVWRAQPHEFGVTVYFPERDPANPQNQLRQRQTLQNIREIVAREKPAHCLATVFSNV